jgi:phytanoyl-CoA hydroxylase
MQKQDLRERYLHEGFIHLQQVIPFNVLESIRGVISTAVDHYARTTCVGEHAQLYADAPFDRRLALVVKDRDPGFRAWNSVLFSKELHSLITLPELCDPVRELLGPEICFNGDYHLRPKLPRAKASEIPWHNDSLYFGETSNHLHILTVVVPLVENTRENGCIYIAPGSHGWGALEGPLGPALDEQVVTRAEAEGRPIEPCLMQCGDVLIFGNKTFHASFSNTSPGIRWTIDLRYCEASQLLDGEQAPGHLFRQKLESIGYSPFIVPGDSQGGLSWDEWREVHLRRNNNDLNRMNRYA